MNHSKNSNETKQTNNKLKVRTHTENGFYNSSVYVLPLNIHITQLSDF